MVDTWAYLCIFLQNSRNHTDSFCNYNLFIVVSGTLCCSKENAMKPYVLPLNDSQADLETVGGKGMSLAKMINAGLPVPGGFHVTTEAYRCFVSENKLHFRIMEALDDANPELPASLETVSQVIGQFFIHGQIPPDIASAVSSAYSSLKNAPVAVRSSATAEDLPDASFAGQQETFLNICGADDVLIAVKKCWASLWTARAIGYRMKNNINQNTVALAVVVQELVFAESAGIMFTANPINGKRDEIVINSAWGLGEAVVSGAVTPDTVTVKKDTGRIIKRETAKKQVMTIRTEQGTSEVNVPDNQKYKAVLNKVQTMELARLGTKIEKFYEMPMDVEWAYADGKFAIVQARPITALPLDWTVPVKAVYARSSLAEHIPSPVTPLFATLGLELANEATTQMWDRIIDNGARDLVPSDGMYQAINGYVFGGVKMGGKNLLKIVKMSISQIGPMFSGSVARWQVARKELAAVVEAWEQVPVETLSASELLEGVQIVYGAACRYFTHIQTTLPAASSSEVLFTRLYNSLIRGKQDHESSVFLVGCETISLKAEKSLYDLHLWLKDNGALSDYVLQTPTEHQLAALNREHAPEGLPVNMWEEWRQRFQNHLEAFGRTAYEFDFAYNTPFEAPGPMLDAIKAFLEGKANNPYERQREAVQKREQATQAVLNRVGWPRKGWFLKLLRWAQETNPMREDSIFDMGMGHVLVRRMFAELGRRFVAGGALDQPDEIYWLEKSELLELISALEAGKALPNMVGSIPERKALWQEFRKVTPPVMLPEKSGWTKLVHGGEAVSKDGIIVLKGVGTSSGSVTAPACVLFGPEDFGKIKPGDVLVAVTTTPAWTPLFAIASAVVTDIGGPLSHSSIVAREYGIPAVMAARSATRLIKNGQMVTVNGAAGTVILE
jgi:rifampicin phosphotransferase